MVFRTNICISVSRMRCVSVCLNEEAAMVFDGNYIDKAKSAEWSDRLNRMSDEDFELVEAGWKELNPQAGPDPLPEKALDPEYREMRQVIVDAWRSANASPKSYMIDLNVGLALYEFL